MPGPRNREYDDGLPDWPSKKIRREAYGKGAVLKVVVHNFMTFKDAEILPGPHLNLVLGPNGTGKSSFTCALCIGLAGGPGILGRAENVMGFIRRGEAEAWTEIHLSGGAGRPDVVILRKMKVADKQRADGTEYQGVDSTWRINGKEVPMKEVTDKVAELNIQLQNLCSFLPQDKVASFANLKPEDLLRETLTAIGDMELYNQHQKLIQMQKDLKARESEEHAQQAELENLERNNQALQRDVARFEEKEKLNEEVDAMKKKRPWITFAALQEDYKDCKEKLEAAKELLARKQSEVEQAKAPLRQKQEEYKDADRKATTLKAKVTRAEQAMDTAGVQASVERLVEELHQGHGKLEKLHADWRSQEGRVQRLAAELAGLEQQVEREREQQGEGASQRADEEQHKAALQRQANDLRTQCSALDNDADEKANDVRTIRSETDGIRRKIADLDNVKIQRLSALERTQPGITEFYRWLEGNRERFQGPVYGPILLEIEVEDPACAAYLESTCGRTTKLALSAVFEDL
ncbi:hypothetical protein WJX84_008822 [Apatococcus fuscideae]|uniref:Structural maintenance of chromosomes protein 5 n=1 Tax=Apatococcus fuscideae TaxID=2026836 RepID=A0AAW1STR6_9CHLO